MMQYKFETVITVDGTNPSLCGECCHRDTRVGQAICRLFGEELRKACKKVEVQPIQITLSDGRVGLFSGVPFFEEGDEALCSDVCVVRVKPLDIETAYLEETDGCLHIARGEGPKPAPRFERCPRCLEAWVDGLHFRR